jgi:hypothetical protein
MGEQSHSRGGRTVAAAKTKGPGLESLKVEPSLAHHTCHVTDSTT